MNEPISPESLHYLLAKLTRGEQIYYHEVIDVIRANPGTRWEGELHQLLLDALEGRLKAKPGPKNSRSRWDWRCIQAAVEFRAADILEARSDPSWQRDRDTLSPKEQAYEEIARQFRLAGGRALQNRLSSLGLL